MALQQFAKGFKIGMTPYLSQAFENKAADKEMERKLKYLKQVGDLQLKQKQLEERMQYEDQLSRFSSALKRVPGLPQQTPGLLAAGIEPSKVGMEMPLGPRGQNLYELQKMRLQEGIESEKTRQLSEKAQANLYNQKEITQDPGYQRLMAYYKMLQEEYNRARGELKQVEVEAEDVDEYGFPVMRKEWQYVGGNPEEAKRILIHIREIERELFGRSRPEGLATETPQPQEQPVNWENYMLSMYPQRQYTGGTQKEKPFIARENYEITSDPEFQKRVRLLMKKGISRDEAEQKILGLINQ